MVFLMYSCSQLQTIILRLIYSASIGNWFSFSQTFKLLHAYDMKQLFMHVNLIKLIAKY